MAEGTGTRAPVEGLTRFDELRVLVEGGEPWSIGESSAVVGARADQTGTNVVAYRTLAASGATALFRTAAQLIAPTGAWRDAANVAFLSTGALPPLPPMTRLREGERVIVVSRIGADGPSLLGNAETDAGPSLVWRNPLEPAGVFRVEDLARGPPGRADAPLHADGFQPRAYFRLRVEGPGPEGRYLGLVPFPESPALADVDYVPAARAAVFVYGHDGL